MPDDAPIHDPGIEDTEITPQADSAPPEKINKGLFGDDDEEAPAKKPTAKKPDKPKAEKKAEPKKPAAKIPDENLHDPDAEEPPAEEPEAKDDDDEEGGEAQEAAEGEEPKAGEDETKAEGDNDNDFEVDVEMTVNGKKVTKTFTLQELSRHAQKAAAADERFTESKQMYEAAKAHAAAFRKDPLGMYQRMIQGELERNGHSRQEARKKSLEYVQLTANRFLAPVIEEANLPEPERRKREIERDIQELELRRQQLLEESEREALEARAEAAKQQLRRGLRAAFNQSGREMTQLLEARAADRFYHYKEIGIDVTPIEAVTEILREEDQYLRAYLESAEPETLLSLRPDLGTHLAQTNLRKVRAQQERALNGDDGDVPVEEADRPRATRKRAKPLRTWDELEAEAGPHERAATRR